MKWENDGFAYEKWLLFDGIMKFLQYFEHNELQTLTVSNLADFVDGYFDRFMDSVCDQDAHIIEKATMPISDEIEL